jgi:hypothetical protein
MKSDLIEWGVSAGSGMVPGHWLAIIRRNLRDASMTGRFHQSGGRTPAMALKASRKPRKFNALTWTLAWTEGPACLYQ